ncbi:MAG: hypothetical protein E7480_07375 [Ruminococcaceae bacterium]|nr:hypothetical protein [Oscillospiraceae bacterium]
MKSLKATLLDGAAKAHREANRKYLLSLDTERIFANFYIQAGLNSNRHTVPKHYGGWEEADTQVHGNIAGHYLSACAMYAYYDNDVEMLGRVIKAVDILEMCQNEGEDGWVSSLPSVYLDRIARNKWVWAPMYNLHKTSMGLADAYRFCKIEKAAKVLGKLADWFVVWTDKFSYERMQDILDWETGGMMEVWAQMYELTKEDKYKLLMERFAHYRFFNPILEGKDILSYTHANTTIPEAHGFAMAYKATGDEKYKVLAERYLEQGVFERECYCTGGQNSGEGWLKTINYADLGDQNQEHCTVYNMIRLCEYIMEWNEDVRYADYIERGIINGLMAQHRVKDGMNAYYLPLGAGRKKDWSTPFDHMTCCLGTTMQANASYEARIFFEKENGVVVSQYIPSELDWKKDGKDVKITMTSSAVGEPEQRPAKARHIIKVSANEKTSFTLTLRVPIWSTETTIFVNGKEVLKETAQDCKWFEIPGEWQDDTVEILLKQELSLSKLGSTDYYAVLYGPTVLAGLTDNDNILRGINEKELTDIVRIRSARDWNVSMSTWVASTDGSPIIMKPINEIDSEIYTVYFKK